MSPFAKTVLKSIAFADAVGGIPLTTIELYKHYLAPLPSIRETLSFSQFLKLLESARGEISPHILHYRGFYFLRKNEIGYARRLCVGRSSVKKWRTARRTTKIFSFLPFVRLIAVTGSLANQTTNPKSDIDILIVSKGGYIWATRLLASAVTQILGKRRHGKKIADRICLNHYITDASLALRPKHLFSAYIANSLIPLWDKGGTYKRFLKQNRDWTCSYFQNYSPEFQANHAYAATAMPAFLYVLSSAIEFLLSKIAGKQMETLARVLQVAKIGRNIALGYAREGEIIFDNHALVFHHPRPKEQESMYLYEKNLRTLGIRY